jgi:lysophospholipase L1-like esterase
VDRTLVRLAASAAATAAVTAGTLAAVPAIQAHQAPAAARPPAAHWVHTWTSMPQLTEPGNLPPAPFTKPDRVFADSTVRQTIHVSVGGRQLRLRFSNAFGTTALPITEVQLGRPVGGRAGVGSIEPGSARQVTFDDAASVLVPAGAQVVSDPINLAVAAQSNLTVTIYLAAGQASQNITSHPGSRTTSYLLAGNHAGDIDLPGATTVDHWYFLSGAEVLSPGGTAAVVMLGDSLTDGRGSTTNQNDRWPDDLLARLQSRPATADVAVLNQAAGGNRVLNDGLGPNALGRIDRDVLATSGVSWLLVFEGVNDIGTAAATPAAQQQVAADLIAAYRQIIVRAHAQGITVDGATITPFGGNTGYDDPAGVREAARQAVNRWIRTSGRFDGLVDFDRAARDPADPRRLRPDLDVGDHLHLNPAGYQVLADTVPDRLFRPAARPGR